ncbi:MAG: NAD-glutamate dehydrogenase domain-containing protein, partial [Lysobacteraceae bacterium]
LLNTDFIDNSAGVDTSDHEVNIKILLNAQVKARKLSLPERNKLLASMTDEVAALVLNDNYRQNQALSLMQRMSLTRLGSKQHFIRTLESQGLLDRAIEYLPTDAEIAERKARGIGLTRPELSVLLSYSKLALYQQLVESDVPEDAYLSKELVRYFPEPLQKKYAKAMEQHRLKREIIATAVTNSMVNRMGATFTLRMTEDTGRTPGEVAKAYTISREALDVRGMWAQIDALDGKVAESVQVDALLAIWNLLRGTSRWLLSRPGALPPIAEAVERYRGPLDEIRKGLPGLLPGHRGNGHATRLQQWRERGVPDALATQLAALPLLDAGFDIVELARQRKLPATTVARVFYALGDALHLPWLLEQIDALPVEGRWHAHARGVLRDELRAQQRLLVGQLIGAGGKRPPEERLAAWLQRDDAQLRFTQQMFAELMAQNALDYPTASVAVRRLAQMAEAEG